MDIGTKFSLLTRLPLMQGISGKELADIEGALGLDVLDCDGRDGAVVRQGDPCTSMIFLTDGVMRMEYVSPDGTYGTVARVESPLVLEPCNLYGIHCRYAHTYIPEGRAGVMSIDKHHVNSFLMKSEIFRLNYMNAVCSAAQKLGAAEHAVCRCTGAGGKVMSLLRRFFEGCRGTGEVSVRMTDLAGMIQETRLNTSRALNDMQAAGLVELRRGKVVIPDIDKLFVQKYE